MEEQLNVYEVGYLLSPLVAEEKVVDEVNNIRLVLEASGGLIVSEENPKMIGLAYTVSKSISSKKSSFDNAYFGAIKFSLLPNKISEVKVSLDKNDLILRFLIIKTVKDTPRVSFAPASMGVVKTDPIKVAKVETKEKETMTEQEIDKEIEGLLEETQVEPKVTV